MKILLILGIALTIISIDCKIKLKSIIDVGNIKEYKKILKTNKNVLTLFSKDDKSALTLLRWMEDVAKDIKGKGTIVYINCGDSKDAKKLCKKYGVNPKPKAIKHYKDGEFHKDYDRKDTAKSLLNFMLDPTGDAPWEEDPAAKNVVQVSSEKELVKLRRKEKGPLLIMFYAPWCGYCKRLKPDYAAAATELKGKAVLAGMDVDKPDAFNVRYQFNITGFPTLIYFENGEQKFNYGGKMDKEGIISWLKDPKPAEEKKEEIEQPWSEQAPEILHLTDATFDEGLKEHASIIVMFYAPWCGHCKAMKPEYVEAAKQMTEEEIPGKLAAVDCTKEQAVCKKFDVSGYPTVKYFSDAEFKFKLSLRKKDEIVKFMKNPEEPPKPPPEDLPWPEVSGPEILHLTDATFKNELKKKKHVLVMFYAPWCGHCKKAKPEYEKAADHYKDDRKVYFAGVDCTVEKKTCEQFDVSGFPTFRYFLYGKKDFKYESGRTSDAFIKFMEDPKEQASEPAMEEPQWKDTPSGVVHLGDDDFEDFLKSHASLLVMFYAPWCGHCKAMKPAYTDAANELLGTDHAIAAVDCTKNRKLASKYSINGYPTLKYFKNGEPSEYDSGRDKDSIVSFLIQKTASEPAKKQRTGWAAEGNFVHHLDSDNFDDHLQQYSSVLVMFYAPWCGHCKRMKPDYADAAAIVNHEKKIEGSLAAVDCTSNSEVCKKYEIRGYPTLKYFKNGVKTIDYSGGRDMDDIISFMMDPKPPKPKPVEKDWADEGTDIVFLTPETFEDFVVNEKSVFVMFYAPWCGHCKKMKPAFAEAAKIINNGDTIPGKLAAVDCVKHKALATKYSVKGFPTLKYFKDGKDSLKYRGGRTKEAIIDFMKNPKEGATAENPKKVVKTWGEQSTDVHQLTNATFDEFLQEKNVLVTFYAPWCGHCSSMKDAFFQTAKKLKEDNIPAVLAAIDATQAIQIAKREGVRGYPTVNFYRNGKLIAPFEKHRTMSNMYEFVQENIGKERATRFDKERWEDLPSSVKHLTDTSFQQYVDNTVHVLVAFHTTSCEKCTGMRTNLIQAASRLAGKSGTFGIAAINCESYTDFCNDRSITDFPTIKYFNKGKFVENYSTSTKVEDVINFLQSKHKEEL